MTTSERVSKTLEEPFARLGLKKRMQGIFTLEIDSQTLGWLGLNTATKGYPVGVVGLNVVVGIRSEEIERLVADLTNSSLHPYIPPTVRTSLGRLSPERRYREWIYDSINDTDGSSLLPLVDSIRLLALPFMQSNVRLVDLHSLLKSGSSSDHDFPYRLVAADLLLGNTEDAYNIIKQELSRMATRTDVAAENTRTFASAAISRFALSDLDA
jgi:hypothetical protein